MAEELKRILKLQHYLGMAIGALECINAIPYDFNKDGLKMLLKELRACINEETGPKPGSQE